MDAADFFARLGGKGQLAVVTKTTQDVMLEPWLTSDVITSRVVQMSGAGVSFKTNTTTSNKSNKSNKINNNNNNQLPSQPYAMFSAHIPHLHLSSLLGGGMLIHLEIAPMRNIILDRNLTAR